MTKIYSPNDSPEDLQELQHMVKETTEFLNSNPEAKALMQDPESRNLSEEEFISRLLSIANRADSDK